MTIKENNVGSSNRLRSPGLSRNWKQGSGEELTSNTKNTCLGIPLSLFYGVHSCHKFSPCITPHKTIHVAQAIINTAFHNMNIVFTYLVVVVSVFSCIILTNFFFSPAKNDQGSSSISPKVEFRIISYIFCYSILTRTKHTLLNLIMQVL